MDRLRDLQRDPARSIFPHGEQLADAWPIRPRRLRLAVEHLCQFRAASASASISIRAGSSSSSKKGWMEHLKAYKNTSSISRQHPLGQSRHQVACSPRETADALCGRLEKDGTTLKEKGITGVFCGGTEMTSQWIRFAIEELLGPGIYIAPTYGNTLMLGRVRDAGCVDGFKINYYAPQPRAVAQVVDSMITTRSCRTAPKAESC